MYDRHKPFSSTLKEIYRLNRHGSKKETYHLVLDIKDSNIKYNVGDSVGILPHHDPELVERTLSALGATGTELITDKKTAEVRSLRDHLMHKVNITKAQKVFLKELEKRQTNPSKKEFLAEILKPENQEKEIAYIHSFELWDLLLEHPEVTFSPQEICDLLPALLPRFYSIASSSLAHPEEIHLTVAISDFEANGVTRRGVGTHFLCRLSSIGKTSIPLYIQDANGFTLPDHDHTPIIMVGPGTGVAPFRAFMQERHVKGAQGKNWLFFGEWTQSLDFLYEEFWTDLNQKGILRLDCAFSRDQEHKIYVQHKLQEQSKEIWHWLQEGAHFYVCGDAHRMAKEVDQALHAIVKDHGNFSDDEAKSYMKLLRKEKRYLRDVY